MASPDAPAAAPQKPSRAVGCALWGSVVAIVLALVVMFLLDAISRSIGGGEMPPLRRPMAVLQGAADLDPATPSVRIETELRLDEGAITAMGLGDGLVHFELDVEAESSVEALLVGVSWPDRAQVLRPVEPLPLDEDVRWTLACADVAGCSRTIGVEIELPPGTDATEASWRLVAEVRPPRESEVPETAVVELIDTGGSE